MMGTIILIRYDLDLRLRNFVDRLLLWGARSQGISVLSKATSTCTLVVLGIELSHLWF